MKLRKIFALLMTFVMLLGMMPSAGAQGNMLPGENFTVACNHNWSTRWPNGRPSNCTEWKKVEEYCTRCGEVKHTWEECGRCQEGNWQWVNGAPSNCQDFRERVKRCKYCGEELNYERVEGEHSWYTRVTEKATCTDEGWQEVLCRVCGSEKDKPQRVPPLGHDWTEWYTDTEPTCTERGITRRDCQRCGTYTYNYLEPTGHAFGEWHVTIEPKPGIPGEEQRECSKCGLTETRELPPLEGEMDISAPTLTLSLSSTPANGTHFVVGEEVTFTEHWSNGTGKTLYPFSVSIWTCGTPVFGSEIDQICSWFAEDGGGPVVPGQSGSHSLTVTVTEADVARGAIYAGAEILSTVQDGPDVPNVYTPFVSAPCGPELDISAPTLTLSLSSTPANGTHFVVGEEVTFTERWSNGTDKTLYPLSVSIWTCGTPVFGSEIDQICSWFAEDGGGPVVPGQSGSHSLTVTVTEADVARGAIYAGAEILSTVQDGPDVPNVYTPFVSAPCGEGEVLPTVTLIKSIQNPPANGEFFVPGEQIEYGLTLGVYGPGKTQYSDDYVVDNPVIYDPLKGGEGIVLRVEYTRNMGHSFRYTVTEEDARRGYVENTAYATWTYRENGEAGYCESETVIAPCGPADMAPVSLVKGIRNNPANGAYFVPGEEIVFDIAVHNNSSKTLDAVVLTDPLSADFFHELLDIPGGAMDSRTLRYTVTEFDAEIGSVINYAYAVAYVDDQPMSLTSNSVTAPCGFPDKDGDGQPDDPYGIHAALDVIKSVESLPLNGSYYQEGETVAYKITYTNTGETPLTNVTIHDALFGLAEIASAETLQPGESRVCRFNYTVMDFDVFWGAITNTAAGKYEAMGYSHSATSNMVKVPTSTREFHWVYFTPWDPTDPPEYDPEIGWDTITDPTDPSIPTDPFGTIDTDVLHNGESYCVRTIAARDNASATYETSFCIGHKVIQASVFAMGQAAAAPEMQMQAAVYAMTLWRAEAEKLYQEMFEAADSQAKATLMTEYIRFLTDTANYEAVLNVLYPDQPAVVAQKIAAIWEEKVVAMCYEAHASADQRTDSLLSVAAASGAAAEACTCEAVSEEAGKKVSKQSFCAVHSFPYMMIDAFLQGEDTAEAWTRVRQIWWVELTNGYNRIASLLGENSVLATAEYNALTQWMMAREASLIALYPNNPELVAQTMVKLIMERVNELCQIAQ